MALNGKKLKAYLARRKMAKEGIETYDNGNGNGNGKVQTYNGNGKPKSKNGSFTKAAKKAKAASVSYVKRKGKEAYAEAKESLAYRAETGRLSRRAYRESTRKARVSAARKRAVTVVTAPKGTWGAGLTEALTGSPTGRRAAVKIRTVYKPTTKYVKGKSGVYKKVTGYKKGKKKARTKAKPKRNTLSKMLGV